MNMNKEQKEQNETVDESVVETILENDQEQANEANVESTEDETKIVEIDYKDKYLRLLAEQDNLHKQLTRKITKCSVYEGKTTKRHS